MDWLTEESRLFLKRGYLQEGVEPEERIREIADYAEYLLDMEGFGNKFYDYMSKGYYSLASPIWSNYGTGRGLPVSCFGSYVGDSVASILATHSEVGMMSKLGGGTSGYFGDVRPRGTSISRGRGESTGSVSFMEMFDTLTNVVSQGSVRRGRFSPYLPIEHADFDEFVGIGSDEHPIQNLTHGVTVTDNFMYRMIDGDQEGRRRWAKVIQARAEVGYPYIIFIDNVNNNKPQVYKDQDRGILASNLCSEIALPSSEDESFVCVLSSMNLLHYDEWKTTDAVEVLTYFLDSVVTEFINKAQHIERAVRFAMNHRALGIGALGWHSYLQSRDIPFESKEAAKKNLEVFNVIGSRSRWASERLANIFGAPPVMVGRGLRNATTTAVAPTKSSSFILGQVSASIEPEMSNYYVKDLAKMKVVIKNKYLEETLKGYGMDTEEVWNSIRDHDGSVQHLEWLLPHHKEIYKTFGEINQEAIINQVATRQSYIDQSQSLNLMIGPSMSVKEINKLYIHAWRMGVKSLYYQFSTSAAQEMARNQECVACSA